MFEEVIVDQNAHWEGDFFEGGIARRAMAGLKKYLDARQVISIVGVRRCGKSTLLRQTITHLVREKGVPPENILFLNLENPYFTPFRNDVRNLEKIYADYLKLVDPQGKIYVFLDEVQYFADWQVFVKSRYESDEIKFVVSGSNSQLLSSELITLLSGRTLPLTLYPFDFSEYLPARDEVVVSEVQALRRRNKLRRLCEAYLAEGGFPEVVLTHDRRLKKDILINYARNILYQDIVPRFELKKPYDVERLFFYLISNIGGLFTYNKLAKLVALSDKTVKAYVDFFADAFLLHTLDKFSFSVREQIRAAKKIYCVDNGLASSTAFSFSANLGCYLENMVFGLFLRQGQKAYFYKTGNDLEVDFFCPERSGPERLVQVCADMSDAGTRRRELRALSRAADELHTDGGVVVTMEEEGEIEENGKLITMIPAWKYLRF